MWPVGRASLWLACTIAVVFVSAYGSTAGPDPPASSSAIKVVAAENFYGDIVQQLGGSHVAVTSILVNPNADPHAFEANVQTAIAVSEAHLVLKNGGGYDSWMDRLLSASPNSQRLVLTAYDLAPVKLPDNEHVWYSIVNVQAMAQAINAALKQLDAAAATTFDSNLQSFTQALQPVQQKMDDIRGKWAGTPVGVTETIYLYQAGPLGLQVLTPLAFQKAIAEGNDPPVSVVLAAANQIRKRQVKVLIYNEQMVTPITENLLHEARTAHLPIMPVTETMPAGKTYQAWMLDQLLLLEQALGR